MQITRIYQEPKVTDRIMLEQTEDLAEMGQAEDCCLCGEPHLDCTCSIGDA